MWDLIGSSVYAGILLSIAIGIIGSLIVINKSTSITGSIAHGSFGGIGIGLYFGVNVLLLTMAFTVFLAFVLGVVTLYFKERQDSLIGVIWALGMSVGIIFLNLTSGYQADALSYLFGNILLVGEDDLKIMAAVDFILIVSVVFLYNRFLAMSYDMDFLRLRGINTAFLYFYFLILTSLTIVMSVRAIGIILILALFTIPSLIAEKFTKKFYQTILLSSLIAVVFIVSGILISYYYDLSPTPVIVLIASFGLFLSMLF